VIAALDLPQTAVVELDACELPEQELVRRCLAGDRPAQNRFVARYARLVFSVCRRRGLSYDAAEDVAQEVLLEAFQALPRFRGAARLSTWLFTLASRHVAHYLRSPARRQLALGHPGDAGFPEPAAPVANGLETRTVECDRQAHVRSAVELLAEPARSVLLAYYVAEMSVAEIARDLGLAQGTVKSHLHRGRRAVRERLEGL
jgi:RNA polymerase sigma-70 factor, ECF subfamily